MGGAALGVLYLARLKGWWCSWIDVQLMRWAASVLSLLFRKCDHGIEAPQNRVACAPASKTTYELICRILCPVQVQIDSCYAALVVGICVLVGFATSLDPRVNLMDAAAPCLLYYSLTGRMTGRLYM